MNTFLFTRDWNPIKIELRTLNGAEDPFQLMKFWWKGQQTKNEKSSESKVRPKIGGGAGGFL